MKRLICGYQFSLIAALEIEREANGAIREFDPLDNKGRSLSNAPFCRFAFPTLINRVGVYAIDVKDEITYVGKTNNLSRRFGPGEYAEIRVPSPIDPQTTNRRVNHEILEAAKRGDVVDVWFHDSDARDEVEKLIIESLVPAWNREGVTTNRHGRRRSYRGDQESRRSVTKKAEKAKRAFCQDRIAGERLFAELLDLHPKDGMVYLKRAEALEYSGDTASAARDFELAEKYFPIDKWRAKARMGLERIRRIPGGDDDRDRAADS